MQVAHRAALLGRAREVQSGRPDNQWNSNQIFLPFYPPQRSHCTRSTNSHWCSLLFDGPIRWLADFSLLRSNVVPLWNLGASPRALLRFVAARTFAWCFLTNWTSRGTVGAQTRVGLVPARRSAEHADALGRERLPKSEAVESRQRGSG